MDTSVSLQKIYERSIREGNDAERAQALEDASEAALFDGDISREQYNYILQLYASVTGDDSVLCEIQ